MAQRVIALAQGSVHCYSWPPARPYWERSASILSMVVGFPPTRMSMTKALGRWPGRVVSYDYQAWTLPRIYLWNNLIHEHVVIKKEDVCEGSRVEGDKILWH